MSAIVLALLAFVIPVAVLIIILIGCSGTPIETVSEELSFLNEHYTKLAGVPVSIGSADKEGFDCIIDFQDGTLGLGIGETPWEAYNSAKTGERYLGTTGL